MNLNQMLIQAQQMQRRVDKKKKEYEEQVFEFASQQDIIKGKMNGKAELTELVIDPKYLTEDNKDMLEDLLIVTINEKANAINKEKEDMVNAITNGVNVSAFL